MRQYEAVVKVMEHNGGYATLGQLYEHVLDVPGCEWKTRTPFASIRRIVQVHTDLFFKVKPGLWALTAWRDRLPAGMQPAKHKSDECREFSHAYYQGLILQLGNLRDFQTHVPPQDKNRAFLGKGTLGDLASLREIHPFSYPHLIGCARTVDVVWFNERRMPAALFEVEHSTDMKNSLVKYVELQDFRTDMIIVAVTAELGSLSRRFPSRHSDRSIDSCVSSAIKNSLITTPTLSGRRSTNQDSACHTDATNSILVGICVLPSR